MHSSIGVIIENYWPFVFLIAFTGLQETVE